MSTLRSFHKAPVMEKGYIAGRQALEFNIARMYDIVLPGILWRGRRSLSIRRCSGQPLRLEMFALGLAFVRRGQPILSPARGIAEKSCCESDACCNARRFLPRAIANGV
jgi:hypothetical protein